MHWFSRYFYMEAKIGPSDKRIKTADHKRNEVQNRTNWRETKKIQVKLAATCNKNKQQEDAKHNAEIQNEWIKTTWKTSEENIRRGQKRSTEA